MKSTNPFSLSYSPESFFNREIELQQLTANADNGLNTLLHSQRRLGKTALIKHLFYQINKSKSYDTIFVDLFATSSMSDLIKVLAEAILYKYQSKNIVKGVKDLLKGISPSINFSQEGSVSLNFSIKENQQENTLKHLFDYLEKKRKRVIIAFDEFQEISSYPEKAEAMLRTHIQQLNNVNFLYSGSSNHILQEMFYSSKRPFYQSSEVIVLQRIDKGLYYNYINDTFKKNDKIISEAAIDYILEFSETYTYYTQLLCNQCFYKTEKEINKEEVIKISGDYIESRKLDYQNIINLLSENQKKMIIALAKEDLVQMPTSLEFIIKYSLPAVSSSLQALNSLLDKEIAYKTMQGYTVYDVFLKRFLEKYY